MCDRAVSAVALHPDGRMVATGGGKADGSVIFVWDSISKARQELPAMAPSMAGPGGRRVGCLAFSADGSRLLAVGTDQQHTVAVYDWRAGKLLAVSVSTRRASKHRLQTEVPLILHRSFGHGVDIRLSSLGRLSRSGRSEPARARRPLASPRRAMPGRPGAELRAARGSRSR